MTSQTALPPVMVLAAGRGSRMQALTDHCPKPLLKAAGKPLLAHLLDKLARQGFSDVVINIDYLGEQIIEFVEGFESELSIIISDERDSGALETAGGIVQALPLIDADEFLLINADVYVEIKLDEFVDQARPLLSQHLCVLGMVHNPTHNDGGDFIITDQQTLALKHHHAKKTMTYAGIGLFRTSLFRAYPAGHRSLISVLNPLVENQRVAALAIQGLWLDVGTPERLRMLDKRLSE